MAFAGETTIKALWKKVTALVTKKTSISLGHDGSDHITLTNTATNTSLGTIGFDFSDGISGSVGSGAIHISVDNTVARKSDLTKLLEWKGSKQTYADLPKTGNKVGDTYTVVEAYANNGAGCNYTWDGSAWDANGGSFVVEEISESWIDTNLTI